MQIIKLELSHFNFFCPVTGHQICGEDTGMDENAPSLMGYWVDEVLYEPGINNPTLKADWLLYEAGLDMDAPGFDIFDDFESFLKNYQASNWIVFKITTSGIACGPSSTTAWYVIDMEEQSIP